MSQEEQLEFQNGIRKQPYSYYGGKQKMASKILKILPKHTVYVEPFFGGGSVFWGKPWPRVGNNNHYREVINDFDSRIIHFMRTLQSKETFEKLQHKLQFTPYSQEEHRKARDILKGEVGSNDIEKAWAWFLQCNMSFSNKVFGGWGSNVFNCNSSAMWANKLDLLPFVKRLISTYISNEDALKCLKRWNSHQSFAYIDPPYIGTDCGHYKGYTEEQYSELLQFLDETWQGSFILSGYGTGLERDHWEELSFETICSARTRGGYDRSKKADETSQNRKRVERLWYRENTVPVRKELQALYDSGKFDCFEGFPQGTENYDFLEKEF